VVAVKDVGVGEPFADGLAALALDRDDAGDAHCRENAGRAINADAFLVRRPRASTPGKSCGRL